MSLPRLVHLAARFGAALLFLVAGAWGALALHFRPPFAAIGPPLSVAFAMLGIAAAASAASNWRARSAISLFAVSFLALFAWLGTIEPSAGRAWSPELAETAYSMRNGDRIVVSNVRNFDWRTETDFTPSWETRTYDLSKLVSTDLIAVYWAGPAIAHTIVSFGFEDGRHLAFSIEVRHGPGEAYGSIAGLFKQFDLIVLAVDERDVLGLRHVRKEEPYLYRLRIEPARARLLFLEYLNRANELHHSPAFYDTIASNCTTVIFSLARAAGFDPPWNWRVLVSGYLPDLAYSEGLLDTTKSLDELRRLGRVEDRYRTGLDSVAFSAAIRADAQVSR